MDLMINDRIQLNILHILSFVSDQAIFSTIKIIHSGVMEISGFETKCHPT